MAVWRWRAWPFVEVARTGRWLAASGVFVLLALAGCARPLSRGSVGVHQPSAREITITAVPLLVHEQAAVLPFLKQAFAPGGVLEGREVYGFVPSTITVVAGDTLRLNLINPEDDAHTFVLPGLSLTLPGQQTTRATYVTREPGIFSFTCDLPSHAPMMWGQLVVLAPEAVGGAARR